MSVIYWNSAIDNVTNRTWRTQIEEKKEKEKKKRVKVKEKSTMYGDEFSAHTRLWKTTTKKLQDYDLIA